MTRKLLNFGELTCGLTDARAQVRHERHNADADSDPPFYYRPLRLPNETRFLARADCIWTRYCRRLLADLAVSRSLRRNAQIKDELKIKN